MTKPKTPDQPTPTTALTPPQVKLLNMLGRAYEEDIPVEVAGKSKWHGTVAFANRTVLRPLLAADVARLSRPEGNYVLLTPRGKAVLGITEPEAKRQVTGPVSKRRLRPAARVT